MSLNSGLSTFSAVLSFAVEIERESATYYGAAANVAGDLAEMFTNYAQRSTKRQQRLVAIRQDNITEIILEPISGLDAADYQVTITPPVDRQQALAQALNLESRAKRFYDEAELKLNVTEPRRAFQKMAQENVERLTELNAAQG